MSRSKRPAAEPGSQKPKPDDNDAPFDLDPGESYPSPAWTCAHRGFVLTARDILRALEGGPPACSRAECRKAGACRNETRGKPCAKKLSPAAENMVELMMVFAARLDPGDITDFYFGEERLADSHRPAPSVFNVETRARLWPISG